MLSVGLEVAVAKENKNNNFRPFAMRHFMFAGTYGADAVSGDCFNPSVVIGLEGASIHLGFGYCLLMFAGTHGADAVSGDCSNFAGDVGLEVASIYLGFG